MNPSGITLWGVGSPRTFRVHWMLLELCLPYDSIQFAVRSKETSSKEFLQLNPRGKVPVLRHEELVITETGAIVSYLAEQFSQRTGFYAPTNVAERVKIDEWSFLALTELDANSLYVIRKHESLASIYGEAPVAVEAARRYFLHILSAMSPAIESARPFLFSEGLSVADIHLAGCLEWASWLGIPLPDSAHKYLEAMRLRPAFKEALKRNSIGSDINPTGN